MKNKDDKKKDVDELRAALEKVNNVRRRFRENNGGSGF